MRSSHRYLIAALALTVAMLYLLPRLGQTPDAGGGNTQARPDKQTPRPQSPTKNQSITEVYDRELIDQLHSSDGDASSKINSLHKLVLQYQQLLGQAPVGENEEITKALSGKNVKGIALLPAKHPSINREGELIDHWGTPYFFHAISRTVMEIRSAGPDRKLHTSDDLILP
ncbi:hypothetical protein HW115_18485 [Verrucomicrobiaceae bacterium N1E253]|uniref:Type II secretion system protein GspG C-terminal domain-containing protein n=1 Tax=Oceaniferula marina TaxID=2748318 RepID=A0A851GKN8_9BACT|nr:hypothetical protein [Oceaniferula marina]NWK57612.1 hypothetical protein [Oceaniferula marina]